jgi:hypothetical protein
MRRCVGCVCGQCNLPRAARGALRSEDRRGESPSKMQLTTTPCVVRATIQPVCARAQHNLALPFAARRTSARCSLRCVPAKIDLNAGTGACADDGMVRMYTCSAQPTASVARFASGGVVALRAARHRGAAVRGSARRSTGVVTMAKVDAAVMINDVTGKMGRAVALRDREWLLTDRQIQNPSAQS